MRGVVGGIVSGRTDPGVYGMNYIIRVFRAEPDTIIAMAESAAPEKGGKIVKTIFEQAWDDGPVKGRAEDIARLPRHRFGPLPAAVQGRIKQASLNELDIWFDRALDAPSLESVFGDAA